MFKTLLISMLFSIVITAPLYAVQGTNSSGVSIVVYPANPPATAYVWAWQPVNYSKSASDPALRTSLYLDTEGTASWLDISNAAPSLIPSIAMELSIIRRNALGSASYDNTGIAFIEDAKFNAAIAYQKGSGGTTKMWDGSTATAFLTTLGSGMNMTASKYAAFVIAEGKRRGPTVTQVEAEYIRLLNQVIPATAALMPLLMLPSQFRTFCIQ